MNNNKLITAEIQKVTDEINELVYLLADDMKNKNSSQSYSVFNQVAKSSPLDLLFVYKVCPEIKNNGSKSIMIDFKNLSVGIEFRGKGVLTRIFKNIESAYAKLSKSAGVTIRIMVSDFMNEELARYFVETRGYTPLNRNRNPINNKYNSKIMAEYIERAPANRANVRRTPNTNWRRQHGQYVPVHASIVFEPTVHHTNKNPVIALNNTKNIKSEGNMWNAYYTRLLYNF